ncbi:ABC transporter ATP-binding protein [Actinocorallia libanotica]|uniref:ABC transporter domain-containing protein n=1 Tax=Actinocorallia libanotica TaxID=46162 RepID=A0ABP4CCZ0_9ACTN
MIELRGVTAARGPGLRPAVRDIDLRIPRRGHTAIVGLSGSGKTTLFSLILRFLQPQEGSLLLNGQAYEESAPWELRAKIAYVEQETPLVPGTIGENLRFSHPEATDEELRRVLREVGLDGKVDSLEDGLDSPLSPATVSGGERQRIALARAILRTPDVLLLDEATAQIDALSEAAVHTVIRDRDRDRDRARHGAVVTIAHRLSTVLDADAIIVMEAGRIRATGTHETLLATDDLYRRLISALRINATQPAA